MSPGKQVQSKGFEIQCYFVCSSWVCSMMGIANLLGWCEEQSISIYGTATEWINNNSQNPSCKICRWRRKQIGCGSHKTILVRKGITCDTLKSWVTRFWVPFSYEPPMMKSRMKKSETLCCWKILPPFLTLAIRQSCLDTAFEENTDMR